MTNGTQTAHLALANERRTEAANSHRAIKSGDLDFGDFLDDPPLGCRKLAVTKVLTWVPNIRASTADKIVERAGIDPWSSVGDLTLMEKYALYDEVTR